MREAKQRLRNSNKAASKAESNKTTYEKKIKWRRRNNTFDVRWQQQKCVRECVYEYSQSQTRHRKAFDFNSFSGKSILFSAPSSSSLLLRFATNFFFLSSFSVVSKVSDVHWRFVSRLSRSILFFRRCSYIFHLFIYFAKCHSRVNGRLCVVATYI